MWDQVVRAVYDVYESYLAIRAVDLAIPTFIGLWLLILALPLAGIDRRDPFSGLMYIIYLGATGVALVFALPSQYVEVEATPGNQVLSVATMMMIAAFRWWYHDDSPKEIEDKSASQAKEKDRGIAKQARR